MKRTLLTTIALIGLSIAMVGCKKDDFNNFDYPLKTLYGTWRITHIEQHDGILLDVTTPIAERRFRPTYATFYQDGTYSGRGQFGDGSGTYTAKDRIITCYVDGREYLKYYVYSLDGLECDMKMYTSDGEVSLRIICKKQSSKGGYGHR